MSVVQAKKLHELSQASDPKSAIVSAIGNLSGVNVMYNRILVGTYIRPERTKGGIIRPGSNVQEDEYQGKVGLVLKRGPMAFQDDEANQFHGQTAEVGEWVVYRVGDGWPLHINGVPCRMLHDTHLQMKTDDPEIVF